MKIFHARNRLTAISASIFITLTALTATNGTASAVDVKNTIDGKAIILDASRSVVTRVAPMGSPLFNHAGEMSLDVQASISNIAQDEAVSAVLEVGYVVGYSVNLFPTGVHVTANTPELTVTSGVNASLNPQINISAGGGGGSIGELGAEAGMEATLIPSSTAEFDINPGEERTVKVAEITLRRPLAEITVTGIRIAVTGAIGTTGAQAYSRLTVHTPTGVYVLTDYSPRTEI
ncbi:MAG: MspA family porin, partial [Mycobacteriaceae bacterium]